jgi:tRNA(Ile)-lysidine synthase
MAGGAPLTDGEFAAAMAALAPFENRPLLAVAVSGGADSMALCLLADGWARARGGWVLALIVDHGLRPSSAVEAERTARWLAARGIDGSILTWLGDKPRSAIQARARAQRYRLLFECCRQRGILHLLVGHHREDQAETLLLRAARGSGAAGLAGMSGLVETGSLRVLRPLLEVPKRRLSAYLQSLGQAWIEDPSNADPAYARARLRAAVAMNVAVAEGLLDAAEGRRYARRARDEAVAGLLARFCRLHPWGFVRLDPAMLGAADEATVAAALGRVAATVGGTAYPPPAEKLARLRRRLLEQAPAACLGRCLWRALRDTGEGGGTGRLILVVREARGLPQPVRIVPESEVEWDGRFVLRFSGSKAWPDRGPTLAALGDAGWGEAVRLRPKLADELPREAAVTLPAIHDRLGLVALPNLGFCRDPAAAGLAGVRFRPRRSLSGPGYCLA